jgi:hypothetical protein
MIYHCRNKQTINVSQIDQWAGLTELAETRPNSQTQNSRDSGKGPAQSLKPKASVQPHPKTYGQYESSLASWQLRRAATR